METPAEGLARLERMAQRAKERREKAEAEERRKEWAEQTERVREELRRAEAEYLAGPPDGCAQCYVWTRYSQYGPLYPGATWQWIHRGADDHLVEKVYHGELPEDVLTCRHPCHGPDGYPRPIILIA